MFKSAGLCTDRYTSDCEGLYTRECEQHGPFVVMGILLDYVVRRKTILFAQERGSKMSRLFLSSASAKGRVWLFSLTVFQKIIGLKKVYLD